MKDFENDLIYYPNPDPIEEPRFILNSIEELEKSTKYSVICNGTERVVYHTDSFDYVIVVDDEAYDLEISIHTPFEKLAIRPTRGDCSDSSRRAEEIYGRDRRRSA